MATTVHCLHYQGGGSNKVSGWVTQTGTLNAFVFWGRTPDTTGSGRLQWQEKPFPEAVRRRRAKIADGYKICLAIDGEVLAQFQRFRQQAADEVRAADACDIER